jgi:hypothetical protein
MTTVAEIITDAFRVSNLVGTGRTPNPSEVTEALRYLNRIIKSTLGNEAGENFTDMPIGSVNIERPQGFPWYSTIPDNSWFVPVNTRLMVNLDESVDLYLHPLPDDGARLAFVDIKQTLSTTPVRVYGNGRLIEGQEFIDLNTDGLNAEWFYRSDLANWMRYSPLVEADDFPFPEEFDEYFIHMLAMRINPAYGKAMDQQSMETFRRAKSQLRARYDQDIFAPSELGIIRMPLSSVDRDQWRDWYGHFDPTQMFNKGRSF